MTNLTSILAILALSVSMLTLGWTIYRDAIRKPRFRVSIAIKTIVGAGIKPSSPFLAVQALNLGPDPNRVQMVVARRAWWRRWTTPDDFNVIVIPQHKHIAASPPAARVEVGDSAVLVIPYDKDAFVGGDFARVGLTDGYGRTHWAPSRQLRGLRKKHRHEFGSQGVRPG